MKMTVIRSPKRLFPVFPKNPYRHGVDVYEGVVAHLTADLEASAEVKPHTLPAFGMMRKSLFTFLWTGTALFKSLKLFKLKPGGLLLPDFFYAI